MCEMSQPILECTEKEEGVVIPAPHSIKSHCEKCGKIILNPDSYYRMIRFCFGHGGGRKLGQLSSGKRSNVNSKKNAYHREYYKKNAEKLRIYYAHRRAMKRKEHNLAVHRYVERNHEIVLAKRKKYYWQNPDKSRASARKSLRKMMENPIKKNHHYARIRKYQLANQDKHKSWKRIEYARRKANKKNTVPFDYNLWLDKVNSSPMCPMCGRFVECKNLTQDHIVPLSKFGYHAITNLQPLCSNCNSSKHNSLPHIDVITDIVQAGGASKSVFHFIKIPSSR